MPLNSVEKCRHESAYKSDGRMPNISPFALRRGTTNIVVPCLTRGYIYIFLLTLDKPLWSNINGSRLWNPVAQSLSIKKVCRIDCTKYRSSTCCRSDSIGHSRFEWIVSNRLPDCLTATQRPTLNERSQVIFNVLKACHSLNNGPQFCVSSEGHIGCEFIHPAQPTHAL